MTSTAVLSVAGVSVEICGRRILHGVDLQVRAGQVTALLGPNGAGKTTLVRAIAGLLPVTEGRVRVGDADLTGRAPEQIRAAGVAVVLEGHRVFRDLSVLDNLRAAGSRLENEELAAGVEAAMTVFPELREHRDRPAGSLSGGQQQMLAIGQAIVTQPAFLVIDELSFGLAPGLVRRLLPVLRSLAEGGMGILLIEQFATLALDLATDAVLLDRGRIGYCGTAADLRQNPDLLRTAYLPRPQALPGEMVGRVAIGFTGSATYELQPIVAAALRAELPDVTVDLQGEMTTPAQVQGLTSGTLDICLLRPPVQEASLEVHVLRTEPLMVALPAQHRLASAKSVDLRDLADELFVTHSSHARSEVHAAADDAFERAGFTPKLGREATGTADLVAAVAAGGGVALVPASVQHVRVTGTVYRPLTGPPAEVALAVVFRVDDPNPIVARVVGRLHSLVAQPPTGLASRTLGGATGLDSVFR